MQMCERYESIAPRPGCNCRACCEVREHSLDPQLVDLISYRGLSLKTSRSRFIVRQLIDSYIHGSLEWASLYAAIIKALMEDNDKTTELLLKQEAMRPSSPYIFPVQRPKGA